MDKIEASAYRRLREIDRNDPKKLIKINKDLIEKARSLGHDQRDGRQLPDLELLAELQHFGAATCLIDFTRSALVALWFACQQGSQREANGKVFAVRHDDMVRLKTVNPELIKEDIDYFLEPDKNGRYPLYQWQPKLQNNRIIAQQSVFVFSGAQIEAGAECVIDKNSKQNILIALDKISGITEANIYPDFDGFARLHAHNKSYIEPDAQDYLQRGIETHQNDNLDDAIEYYTEVIRLDPADTSVVSMAYYNRGVAYDGKNEVDLAIRDYNQTIQLNPNSADAYNNRGYAYRQKGEIERAIEDYDRAIQIKADNVLFYNNRAIALLHLKEWEKAKSDLTIARNMGVDIITLFRNTYASVTDFEQRYDIQMPADLVALLTPAQV
ncbi:tetratricopeptide repeat protein [Candidatus Poribacteria bacterium]|nr:tetratricopeptide repeat protein [Candidatus Poribacteria bacterium]